MKKWFQSYVNEQCDMYPEDIHAMMDVMCKNPLIHPNLQMIRIRKRKKRIHKKKQALPRKGAIRIKKIYIISCM